jgi:hypothetical protein
MTEVEIRRDRGEVENAMLIQGWTMIQSERSEKGRKTRTVTKAEEIE